MTKALFIYINTDQGVCLPIGHLASINKKKDLYDQYSFKASRIFPTRRIVQCLEGGAD